MTREEAIKLLTQYIDYDAETPDYYKMEEACKVAIKALEQEPCEDCITLRLEKGTLKYSDKDYVVYKKEWLKKWWQPELALLGIELPSIQPKPKTEWIPVSERLPEKAGFYLTSIGDLVSTYPFDGNNFRLRDNTCIIYVDAWMPLPESYEEKQGNKIGWSNLENVREKVERGNEE